MSVSLYVIKIVVTTGLVVLISELSKRSTLVGAILASVPLISVLAMTWVFVETHDAAQVASLSKSIFWLVLPSLALFLVLPVLLERGLSFYVSLAASVVVTIVCYYVTIALVRNVGGTT